MNHSTPSSRWPHDIVSCLANDLSQNNPSHENVDDFLASVDAILEELEPDDDDTDRSPQPPSDAETDEDVDVDTLLTDLPTIYDEMMTQPTHTVSTPPPRPPHSPLSFVRRPPFPPLMPFYYHPHPQSVSGIAGTLTPLNIPNTANTPCWVLHQMGHDTYLATTRKGVGGVQWMVHASEMVPVEDCRRVTEEEDGMNDVLRMVDDVLLKEQEPQQPQETVSPIYVYV